jgi:hypothetical protein
MAALLSMPDAIAGARAYLRAAAISVALTRHPTTRQSDMSKSKGGTFRNRDAKTAPANPLPQTARRPTMPSVPRVAPRTRASPKGR